MPNMIRIRMIWLAAALAAATGCAREGAAPAPQPAVEAAAPMPHIVVEPAPDAPPSLAERIVGAVWRRTDAGAAPGSIVLFASGGAMVMASCVETYRIGAWRALDDDTIAWSEQPLTIEADIVEASADTLSLSLSLGGETIIETFERVDGDAICPGE